MSIDNPWYWLGIVIEGCVFGTFGYMLARYLDRRK